MNPPEKHALGSMYTHLLKEQNALLENDTTRSSFSQLSKLIPNQLKPQSFTHVLYIVVFNIWVSNMLTYWLIYSILVWGLHLLLFHILSPRCYLHHRAGAFFAHLGRLRTHRDAVPRPSPRRGEKSLPRWGGEEVHTIDR